MGAVFLLNGDQEFPILKAERVDLTSRVIVDGADFFGSNDYVVETRVQLPFGKSLVCIDVSNPESTNGRRVVVISTDAHSSEGSPTPKYVTTNGTSP